MHSLSIRYPGFIRSFIQMDGGVFRFLCFVAALGVYALWGSPTPDRPGLAEALVGILLCAAVGVSGASRAVSNIFSNKSPYWLSAGKVLLLYGLSIPLLVAGLQGHGPGLVVRDVLPFLFFLLPVFLIGNLEKRPGYAPYLFAVVGGVGLAFALRTLLPRFGVLPLSQELFYFANAPTVLLAGLVLPGLAGQAVIKAAKLRDVLLAGGLLALALIPLLAMAVSVQRATLGAVLLYGGLLLALALWRKPVKAARLVVIGLVVLWALFPVLADIWSVLSRKNSLVGFNMRLQELAAVWEAISAYPGSLFFGLGWGGVFHSPAVGGLVVNFTHSLLSSMLLKTGIVGLSLTIFYLGGLARLCGRILFHRPVLGLALAAPILIDIFLYASFKSLDFGLVLLLIPAYQLYLTKLRDRA